MIFKKLNMEFAAFDTENINDLKELLSKNCHENKNSGPMWDLFQAGNRSTNQDDQIRVLKSKKKGGLRRDMSCVVRDLITALALCHNVTPTFPDGPSGAVEL